MRRRSGDLGVQWYLPGRKRPFASTTVATGALIVLFAEQGFTFAQAHEQINYDAEAKAVLARFVDEGYGDTAMTELGVR